MSFKITTSLSNTRCLSRNKPQKKLTFKANFSEARKLIYLGQPLGKVMQNGLIDVPQELLVPIVAASQVSNYDQPFSASPLNTETNTNIVSSLTEKEIQDLYIKFNLLEGKSKHLWEKAKKATNNPCSAVTGFIVGTFSGPALSIQNAIKDKVNTITNSINEKIEAISLDKLKNMEKKIINTINPPNTVNSEGANPNDIKTKSFINNVDELRDKENMETFSDDIDIQEELNSNDNYLDENIYIDENAYDDLDLDIDLDF